MKAIILQLIIFYFVSGFQIYLALGQCDPNPCQNGGVCFEASSYYDSTYSHLRPKYFCECPFQYAGPNCTINLGCEYEPNCLNDGLCQLHSNGSAYCACKPHYTGINCEKNKTICDILPNICLNNGTCYSTADNSFSCSCSNKYTGKYCEKFNYCSLDPCVNGYCKNLNDTYNCSCYRSYTGKNCDEYQRPCEYDSNCLNGGTCNYSYIKDNYCTCQWPYSGVKCENRIDNACSSNPCLNNGTCVNAQNQYDNLYKCTCPENIFGTNCELDICLSNPCKNNGTCKSYKTDIDENLNVIQTYICTCQENFYGKNCDQFNECLLNSSFCNNYGSCYLNPETGYGQCNCYFGGSGKNCEKIVCGNQIPQCSSLLKLSSIEKREYCKLDSIKNVCPMACDLCSAGSNIKKGKNKDKHLVSVLNKLSSKNKDSITVSFNPDIDVLDIKIL